MCVEILLSDIAILVKILAKFGSTDNLDRYFQG